MFDILLEHHRIGGKATKLTFDAYLATQPSMAKVRKEVFFENWKLIATCLWRIVFRSVGHAADIHPGVLRPDPLGEEVAVPGSALRPGRAPRQHDGGGVQQLEVLRQALDHRLGDHQQ